MYLDRPANRLQSPSGFLSSEQVPPLSLLHVGASTPGFYAKSRCFIFFSKLLLLKANFQNFIFFFMETLQLFHRNSCAETDGSTYRSSLNRYSMEDNFHYNSMANILRHKFSTPAYVNQSTLYSFRPSLRFDYRASTILFSVLFFVLCEGFSRSKIKRYILTLIEDFSAAYRTTSDCTACTDLIKFRSKLFPFFIQFFLWSW